MIILLLQSAFSFLYVVRKTWNFIAVGKTGMMLVRKLTESLTTSAWVVSANQRVNRADIYPESVV